MSYCAVRTGLGGWTGRIRVPDVLIGYMRVSKADGSQTLDPQRDALLAAGVPGDRLYEDLV